MRNTLSKFASIKAVLIDSTWQRDPSLLLSLLLTFLCILRKQSYLIPYFISFFSSGPNAKHVLNEKEDL